MLDVFLLSMKVIIASSGRYVYLYVMFGYV